MFWYRAECRLGRFSVVGTTVKKTEIPRDLLADEHHQKIKGEKCFIATTVGGGCILGAEVAETAGCEDLTAAYGVFGQEAVEAGLNFHGSRQASTQRARAFALLWNFTPWHPAVTQTNNGFHCPAQRLNQHRYHDCWLQNLLISASANPAVLHSP